MDKILNELQSIKTFIQYEQVNSCTIIDKLDELKVNIEQLNVYLDNITQILMVFITLYLLYCFYRVVSMIFSKV